MKTSQRSLRKQKLYSLVFSFFMLSHVCEGEKTLKAFHKHRMAHQHHYTERKIAEVADTFHLM